MAGLALVRLAPHSAPRNLAKGLKRRRSGPQAARRRGAAAVNWREHKKGAAMPKVEVISRRRVFDDFFKVDEAKLRFERYDGTMSEAVRRLNFERGDS